MQGETKQDAPATKTTTVIYFSNGTKGKLCGNIGFTKALLDLLSLKVSERPHIKPRKAEPPTKKKQKKQQLQKEKTWGSGPYPYKKFIPGAWELLRAVLKNGPVLLVVYSFSCRAFSLMFSKEDKEGNGVDNPLLTSDDLDLVSRNLKGIVFLSPPRNTRKERKAGESDMSFDWSQSYGLIPNDVPIHFVLADKSPLQLRTFTRSLHAESQKKREKGTSTLKVIGNSKETFFGRKQELADYINAIL